MYDFFLFFFLSLDRLIKKLNLQTSPSPFLTYLKISRRVCSVTTVRSQYALCNLKKYERD